MQPIFEEAKKLLSEGEPFVLATVVRTKGSTPQKPGAKLLVRKDGTATGTLGGGCVEADVWAEAKNDPGGEGRPPGPAVPAERGHRRQGRPGLRRDHGDPHRSHGEAAADGPAGRGDIGGVRGQGRSGHGDAGGRRGEGFRWRQAVYPGRWEHCRYPGRPGAGREGRRGGVGVDAQGPGALDRDQGGGQALRGGLHNPAHGGRRRRRPRRQGALHRGQVSGLPGHHRGRPARLRQQGAVPRGRWDCPGRLRCRPAQPRYDPQLLRHRGDPGPQAGRRRPGGRRPSLAPATSGSWAAGARRSSFTET